MVDAADILPKKRGTRVTGREQIDWRLEHSRNGASNFGVTITARFMIYNAADEQKSRLKAKYSELVRVSGDLLIDIEGLF